MCKKKPHKNQIYILAILAETLQYYFYVIRQSTGIISPQDMASDIPEIANLPYHTVFILVVIQMQESLEWVYLTLKISIYFNSWE